MSFKKLRKSANVLSKKGLVSAYLTLYDINDCICESIERFKLDSISGLSRMYLDERLSDLVNDYLDIVSHMFIEKMHGDKDRLRLLEIIDEIEVRNNELSELT